MEEPTLINSEVKAAGVLAQIPGEVIPASGIVSSGTGFPVVHAYTLRDPAFGSFEVYKSTGGRPAWWDDSFKVQKLIDAFKFGHSIKEACVYAGISPQAWRDFKGGHPDFQRVMEACESVEILQLMDSAKRKAREDGTLAWQMLKTLVPKYQKEGGKVEAPVLQQTTVQVAVNQNVDNTVDAAAIKEVLTRAAAEILERFDAGS